MMREHQLSTKDVDGSGKEGRVTKQDVLKVIDSREAKPAPANLASPSGTGPIAEPGPRRPDRPGTRRQPMSMLRRSISKRLVAVKNETAMLTTFNEVNMAALQELRAEHKQEFMKKYGVKLGMMSFFVRAVVVALKEFPAVNSMIDGNDIVYHDYVDMGIAVSAPKGLMVPIIRNAEKLDNAGIESAIKDLSARARDGKLSIEEMTDGSFTITNGGVFGSMLSTPIINPPQSGILGMHNIVDRPIAIAGEVVIRPIMYLAFSYDHRIIDGRESVGFLKLVKEQLEAPASLLTM